MFSLGGDVVHSGGDDDVHPTTMTMTCVVRCTVVRTKECDLVEEGVGEKRRWHAHRIQRPEPRKMQDARSGEVGEVH